MRLSSHDDTRTEIAARHKLCNDNEKGRNDIRSFARHASYRYPYTFRPVRGNLFNRGHAIGSILFNPHAGSWKNYTKLLHRHSEKCSIVINEQFTGRCSTSISSRTKFNSEESSESTCEKRYNYKIHPEGELDLYPIDE